MDVKLIDAGILRSKVHSIINKTLQSKPLSPYDQGFVDGLARAEALIDKMQPEQRIVRQQFNMVQNGTGMVIGEVTGDMTIDFREKKRITVNQEAKEVYNIGHVDELRG